MGCVRGGVHGGAPAALWAGRPSRAGALCLGPSPSAALCALPHILSQVAPPPAPASCCFPCCCPCLPHLGAVFSAILETLCGPLLCWEVFWGTGAGHPPGPTCFLITWEFCLGLPLAFPL